MIFEEKPFIPDAHAMLVEEREREELRHALQLLYGMPRPEGHEQCVLCNEWFGLAGEL